MQGDECGRPDQPGLRRLATGSQVLQGDPDRGRAASGRGGESARAHAPRREPDGRARHRRLAEQPAELRRRRPHTGPHGPRRRVGGSDARERLRRAAAASQGALGQRHRYRRERGEQERTHEGPARGSATKRRVRRDPGAGCAADAADRPQLRAGPGRAEGHRGREPTATVPRNRRDPPVPRRRAERRAGDAQLRVQNAGQQGAARPDPQDDARNRDRGSPAARRHAGQGRNLADGTVAGQRPVQRRGLLEESPRGTQEALRHGRRRGRCARRRVPATRRDANQDHR